MYNMKTILVWATLLLTACISDPKYFPSPKEDMKVTKTDTSEDLKSGPKADVGCKGDACIECITNTSCDDAAKSKCSDTNVCVGCAVDADCSHLGDGLERCIDEVCVLKCEKDEDCEDVEVCDLRTDALTYQTCAPDKQLTQCEPCVSDGQCSPGLSCVPLKYDDRSNGYFCLETKNQGCTKPYSVITRGSLGDSTLRKHCGIDEDLFTCASVLDFNKPCNDGANKAKLSRCKSQSKDKLCKQNTKGWFCTYKCKGDEDCRDTCHSRHSRRSYGYCIASPNR